MAYQLIIPERVKKEIEKIDNCYKQRILAALASLKNNPFLGKKLEGEYKDQRSLRIWPYRIIYKIIKQQLVVLVIRIGHRQGIYQ